MPGVPVIGPMMARIFGTRNDRLVKRFLHQVESISDLEPQMRRLTDQELRAKTEEFKSRYDEGESEEQLLPEAFAVAREAMDRAVGIRNIFDPAQEFDASRLPDSVRRLYLDTKAQMEATPDAEPVGDLIGNVEPVPAWKILPIPYEIYDAVRTLYPESRPPFRARPFDVQLVGGMVLAEHRLDRIRSAARDRNVYFGNIAEMKTGEGKTIVAPLACYLHGIAGRQIHVVTVNTYLVRRDRYWTFPFFYHLGLTVGYIAPMHELPEHFKKTAYQCDVVYGTTSEFGFDFLRDNMKYSLDQQVQRRREFAIVDEVDSTLIDEARTPLIISGQAHADAPRYELADNLARHLVQKQKPWDEANVAVDACKNRIKGLEGDIRNTRDKAKIPALKSALEAAKDELPRLEDARDRFTKYYEVEMDKKQVHLEHEGVSEAQKVANIGSFYVGDNIDMPHLLEQALRAHTVYERDRDYVVKDGQVVIVDQFTGRLMVGRQWSDGLHQAVEAKEKVQIKPETQTMATVTIQNFFKLYERLAGMTGTADTEAQEFHDIYNMNVVVIPTNLPVIRRDFQDRVYLTAKDKWSAIIEEIKTFHDLGRPILVGTTSVEKSELLSQQLTKKYGIRHEVLNAKQHEREAQIIANAGALGSVMISTNMAGRGTDIKLHRIDREELINHWKRRSICPREVTPEMDDEEIIRRIYRFLAQKQLEMKPAELDALADEELVRRLLVHWATTHTWLAPKKLESLSIAELRDALDENGEFLLHRLRVWNSTEAMGGLHVIGTERHESRRIDNQLRGRSGRQGDQGSSRFFISLEDDLMKLFAGETTQKVLARLGMKEGDAIEAPMLSRAVERAQRKVEERNFEVRKNILEYDEVMDYQRLEFYGQRQRIIESDNLREPVLEYVSDSVADACEKYLSPSYVPTCIAEWVQNTLDVSIEADRLRGLDEEDLLNRIRKDAQEDARHSIEVTIGEFMSDDVDPVDWDVNGLVDWARRRFGMELTPSEVREMTPRDVANRLIEAAMNTLDEADLTGIRRYLDPDYGVNQLIDWVQSRFPMQVSRDELADKSPEEAMNLLLDKVREIYRDREASYPVNTAIDSTMQLMVQDPRGSLAQLAEWANMKFGLNWDATYLLTRTPQQFRAELVEEARQWTNGKLDALVDEALAANPDPDALAGWLEQRFGIGFEERDEELLDENPREALRRRLLRFLRSELNYLERIILLQILDQSWKDHLYFMDQLRGAISFRGFAQQDPKIEYRREGRRLFDQMGETVRDKVSDFIFKARLSANPMPRNVYRTAQTPDEQSAAEPRAAQRNRPARSRRRRARR